MSSWFCDLLISLTFQRCNIPYSYLQCRVHHHQIRSFPRLLFSYIKLDTIPSNRSLALFGEDVLSTFFGLELMIPALTVAPRVRCDSSQTFSVRCVLQLYLSQYQTLLLKPPKLPISNHFYNYLNLVLPNISYIHHEKQRGYFDCIL